MGETSHAVADETARPVPATPDPLAAFPLPEAPVADPAVPATNGAPAPESDFDDEAFQTDLRSAFLESAPETLAALRKVMQEFTKTKDEANRLPQLMEVYRKVHGLTGNAGIAGLTSISQMAAALEILLKELYDCPVVSFRIK